MTPQLALFDIEAWLADAEPYVSDAGVLVRPVEDVPDPGGLLS